MSPSKRADEAISMIEGDKSKILQMSIGSVADIQPGQFVPKADAAEGPKLGVPASFANETYLAIGVDLDAPYISLPFMSPIVHEIQSGLHPGNLTNGVAPLEAKDTPPTCEWLAAIPPPGAAPHRYVFLLYLQPADYDVSKFKLAPGPKTGIWPRLRFSVEAFEKKAGLGPVVAANYFNSS